MKVIKSLEKRWILLKGTVRKITSQERGFLNFFMALMTAVLPLLKNMLTLLAKSVLIPLRLRVAASAAEAAIQKKNYGSGITALIISNEEMEDIMKIVKPLEESRLLIKEISDTIKIEAKEQKSIFLRMLSGTSAASLLGSALLGRGAIGEVEGTFKDGQKFQCSLIL